MCVNFGTELLLLSCSISFIGCNWGFFLKLIAPVKSLFQNVDKKFTVLNWKQAHYLYYLLGASGIMFLIWFGLKSYLLEINHILASHIKLAPSTSPFLVFFVGINIIVLSFFVILRKSSVSISSDFFFVLLNLMFLLLSFFLQNTLLLFFFILEVNSLLILYKFIISKKWYKMELNFAENTTSKQKAITGQTYLNTIFFQYWTMFCSSIIFIFVFTWLIGFFNAVDWTFINFIHYVHSNVTYFTNDVFLFALWFFFLNGVLLKLGFTPVHLFKIELYKGLSFVTMFFYTTYFFLYFFIFLILIIFYYLRTIFGYWWFFFLLVVLVGGLYLGALLFSLNLIKFFFAYSSVINSFSFVLYMALFL